MDGSNGHPVIVTDDTVDARGFEPGEYVYLAEPGDETVNRGRIDTLAADAIIAGAAVVLDATVVSNDVDDFRELGVSVETYE